MVLFGERYLLMIRQIKSNFYAVCDDCGNLGPSSSSEEDAHKRALQRGWIFVQDFYICFDIIHYRLRELYKSQNHQEHCQEHPFH